MIFHILQLLYHLDFFSTVLCNLKWWELPDTDHCGWRRKSGLKITNYRKERGGHCSGERTGVVTHVPRERELVLCVGYRSNSTRCYLQKDVYSAEVVRAGVSVLSLYFWGQGKSPALIEEIMGSRWRAGDVRIPGHARRASASEFGVYVEVLAWNWCSRKLLSLFLLVGCS